MIWKRSKIKDIEYKFPSGLAKLILEKGEVLVESGYGLRSLISAFDEEEKMDIEILIGKELIYNTDKQNVLDNFLTIEEWEGPEIAPNEEIDYDPPSDIDRTLERITELNSEALYPTDLKEAVIGIVERFGMKPQVLLDKSKCLKIFMERDGMSYEDAIEFFEFNVIGAWMGDGTPCFATLTSLKDSL